MSNDSAAAPRRGSFPMGPIGETLIERRERYELFVLSTRSREPDYEAKSIRFYRGRTTQVLEAPGASARKTVPKQPSKRLCINSRCWQCEHGDDDPNGHLRIANCRCRTCGLHPVRPYQEFAEPAAGAAEQSVGAVSLKRPIKAHCLQCVGGNLNEVSRCRVVTCALWPLRPGTGPWPTDVPPTEVESL